MERKSYRFAVMGPAANGRKVVISRHVTREAANKALKLAKVPGFEVVAL